MLIDVRWLRFLLQRHYKTTLAQPAR